MTTSTLAASVAELAAKGKAKAPQMAARIDRAAAIILAGEWQATSDADEYIIRGYHVNGQCECPDYTLGNAPTYKGHTCCKHILAKAMLATLAEPKQLRCEPGTWERGQAWVAFGQSFKH